LVLAKVGADGRVSLFNGSGGTVHLLADVAGYVVEPTGPAWSEPEPVHPPSSSLVALSCASTTSCTTVDRHGNTFVLRAGAWTRVQRAPLQEVTGLSCAGPSCLAVSFSRAVSSFDGTSWTPTETIGNDGWLTDVSCASAAFCVATTSTGSALVRSGGSWTSTSVSTNSLGLTDVDCVSSSFCVAAAGFNSYRYDGSTWTRGSHDFQIGKVSCAGPASCVVAGSSGADSWDGAAWSPMPEPQEGEPYGLSCSSRQFCLITDWRGQVSTWDGVQWTSSPQPEGLRLTVVDCPGVGVCAALAGEELVDVASLVDGVWTSTTVSHITGAPVAVSCVAVGLCTLMDDSFRARTLRDETWGEPRLTQVEPAYPPLALSCGAETLCVAVTANLASGYSNLLVFDGTSWQQERSSTVWGDVSCTSANHCIALTRGGITMTFDGTTWTRTPSVDPQRWWNAASIDCVSPDYCVAANDYGEAAVYAGGTWAPVTVLDPSREYGPRVVSCSDVGACVLVDHRGRAAELVGSAWTALHLVDADGGRLTDVSCTEGTCVAVDEAGRALTWDGSAWSEPVVIHPSSALTSVSCVTAVSCLVTAHDGSVITRS
ncbi:hypothetical protein, partial [Thalassiella azotivora]